MKHLLTTALIALSLAAIAEEEYISPVTGQPIPKDGKFTEEQYKARDERVMRKTGGFLTQKAEGPLAMVVDSREKATLTADEVARVYKLGCHLDMTVVKESRGEKTPLEFAKGKMNAEKPLFLVMVAANCDGAPILSVFPEERVAIVNADKLKGGDDPTALEMRVNKELWRAIGFVTGVGFSQANNDIMQPIYSLQELDANNYPFIQPMNMAKMGKMWARFGVKKERRIPYRVAVKEGWANAPTNDYQKAVWDEVKSEKERGPTNPIEIPMPKKK